MVEGELTMNSNLLVPDETIYVFEDNKQDKLCKLFDQMYDQSIQNKFIYSESNGKIIKRIKDIRDPKNTDVIVFLDLQPDNPYTSQIYDLLAFGETKLGDTRKTFKEWFRRFIILPIPCREYYCIESLKNQQTVVCSEWVNQVLSRGPYKDQTLLTDAVEAKKCKTWEKFCKRVLYRAFNYCVNTKDDLQYFEQSCICSLDKLNQSCKQLEQADIKRYRCLAAFPCFPQGSELSRKSLQNKLSWTDVIAIHKELVQQYNKSVKRFRDSEKDKSIVQRYKYIKPMY